MIPLLTYPLALIALATVPALAAIYILRNRFRRRQVSSLVLWQFHDQSKSGGAKIRRIQLPLLFFLELLTLFLLVAAACGPRWKFPQSSRPLIVVLNDSFSMRATENGVSTQARARQFLKTLFDGQPPPFTRLILAGTEPRLLGSTVKSWSEASDLLGQWQCWSPNAAMDPALTLAAELGRGQANILVLTDHEPPDKKITNPRLEWHAFGQPMDNFAIVNASRTAFGDEDRCLLEIANDSGEARSTQLLLQTGSNIVQRSMISLGPHLSQRMVFNLPSTAPPLHASLPPDALDADNQVELLPPVRKRVRVLVALTNQDLATLANRALDATGFRAAISQNPDLVIQSSDLPIGSNAWSLVWTTSAATNAYTGPFVVDNSHPLAAGLALDGVVWAGAAATNAPGNIPVILAGNVPLLSEREDLLARRHITLNLNPPFSTVQNTPDWPILFWDILSWRVAEMPGLKENNARLGTEVVLKGDGGPVTIIDPGGKKSFFPEVSSELSIDTPVPGAYSVAMGNSTDQFSVNALSVDASDLSPCTTGQWGRWSDDVAQRFEEASATWILGLLALAFLATHLWLLTTAKGKG
jgi:Aerotolerance regulator N-terminal